MYEWRGLLYFAQDWSPAPASLECRALSTDVRCLTDARFSYREPRPTATLSPPSPQASSPATTKSVSRRDIRLEVRLPEAATQSQPRSGGSCEPRSRANRQKESGGHLPGLRTESSAFWYFEISNRM